jgi:hypothetical protein
MQLRKFRNQDTDCYRKHAIFLLPSICVSNYFLCYTLSHIWQKEVTNTKEQQVQYKPNRTIFTLLFSVPVNYYGRFVASLSSFKGYINEVIVHMLLAVNNI